MSLCTGSGGKWTGGTGSPICPQCHRGWRALKVKRPTFRKGKFIGKVPDHEPRKKSS